MRITCIGIDPAGLYLGIRLKRNDPAHEVRFIARHGDRLRCRSRWCAIRSSRDGSSRMRRRARPSIRSWSASTGSWSRRAIGGSRPGAWHLLRSIQAPWWNASPASPAGSAANSCRRRRPPIPPELPDSDLVVVADGPRSVTRDRCGAFETSLSASKTKHVAFALSRGRDSLAYAFREAAAGIFHAYAVPCGPDRSCVIVEAPAEVIRASGVDAASPQQIFAFCRDLFPDLLDGAASGGETAWREFVTVRNRNWHAANLVVLGSAAYTAHFSVGLDLRAWLEDARRWRKLSAPGRRCRMRCRRSRMRAGPRPKACSAPRRRA